MRFAALALLAVLPAWAARQVAIVVDGQLDPPARYGIAKLEQALSAKGLTVVQPPAAESAQADFYLVAGIGKGLPQSLSIRRSRYRGKPAVMLSGGDARGMPRSISQIAFAGTRKSRIPSRASARSPRNLTW